MHTSFYIETTYCYHHCYITNRVHSSNHTVLKVYWSEVFSRRRDPSATAHARDHKFPIVQREHLVTALGKHEEISAVVHLQLSFGRFSR